MDLNNQSKEAKRFQKWERSIGIKASEKDCAWAIKKSKQLDRARLTKWPTYPPDS